MSTLFIHLGSFSTPPSGLVKTTMNNDLSKIEQKEEKRGRETGNEVDMQRTTESSQLRAMVLLE